MIRIATISDVEDILRIYSFINIKLMNSVKNTEYDFIKYVENGNINVYEDKNEICGFVLFFDHITWGYIELLCVDPKNRLSGIGEKLINSVNDDKWGVVEVCCHLSDEESNLFVKKCGFDLSNQETTWYVKQKIVNL